MGGKPMRGHVTSTAVSIERYDSWARRKLSRSDVSNHATASCSSGAALTGVPVHLSISQICMSNVVVRISCIGGLDAPMPLFPTPPEARGQGSPSDPPPPQHDRPA